jgi:hypothetical protein
VDAAVGRSGFVLFVLFPSSWCHALRQTLRVPEVAVKVMRRRSPDAIATSRCAIVQVGGVIGGRDDRVLGKLFLWHSCWI